MRNHRASTSTFSSINGRESSSINGFRKPSRSPLNDLHEIKESPIEEDSSIEINVSHGTLEVNGNHLCRKDKVEPNDQKDDTNVTDLQIVENLSEYDELEY